MDEKDEVKANWDLWADMEQAKLWEAVALSLDIEPEELSGLDFRPIVGGPFDECAEDFKLRLKLATSKFHGAKTEIRLSNLREWAEKLSRPWSFPDEFPRKPAALHQSPAPSQNAAKQEPLSPADPMPDPERRLKALRSLGGNAIYKNSKWRFTGIEELVQSEKAANRTRTDVKTIRSDLKEAAQSEREARRAGHFDAMGQR